MQAGLLYETLSGRSGSYLQQVVITCRETLDDDALRLAWLALVQRHGALRTSFVIGESALPRQRVHEQVDLGVTIADWRRSSGDERESRWRELLVADRHAGFELAYPPLMRVAIRRFADAELRMVWTYHHAILDGRSRLALLRELFELYAEQTSGQAANRPVPPPFEQFAEWAARRGGDSATEAFWREALAGIDTPTPAPGSGPTDGKTDSGEFGPATISHRLDVQLSEALRSVASAHDLTLATVLQGVYAMLLSQEADTDDLLFATTRAGRRSAPFDTETMVGLLMVTSPVRLQLQPDETFTQWCSRVREFNLAVRDFEHVPLANLRAWSEIPRPAPLAETVFSFETASMNTRLRAGDPAWERRDVQLIEQLDFPLALEVLGDAEIHVNIFYDEARVSPGEAARIMSRYKTLVRACMEAPGATVASVCELDPVRRRALSGETSHARPPTITELVPVRIREQILRHPDRIAVEHTDERLSYAEVGRRVDELAARLAQVGAGPGVLVGVAMGRSPDLICAVLAVHRVGAAYLPLDPRYPAERLAFMLGDSGAQIVVTDASSQAALPTPQSCAVLVVDAVSAAHAASTPASPVAPHDLAYLIYTSGSTGTPKAVMVEHGSLAHLTWWAEQTFTDDERDGILASTSLSFDFSVFEILVTLALGGRIVLVEDISALSEPDFPHQIAFVTAVPSALSELLRARDLPGSVRTVAVGGEALPPALLARLYAQQSVRAVWNLYGPSEDTMCSTAHLCAPEARPLIGRPLPGTQVYVMDRHLRPVPPGVAGELLIGGLGLARGYLARPELTAECFRNVTFSDGVSTRVYRSGDRARWAHDGSLDYLGRRDDQTKIRGVRVEPGELAHALREQDSVDDAAVVAVGDGAERKLMAYVVGADGEPPDVASLRTALAARLPAALLPSAIVVMDALPLTPSGKLDRRALPQPGGRTPTDPARAPTNDTQRALADLWTEVLDLSGPVGGSDDFFLLGGDSLSSLHLLAAVEEHFGRRLSVGTLLSATTLTEQAAAIDAARAEPASSALIPLRPSGSRPPWICVLTDHRAVIGMRNVLPAVLSDQPVYAMQAIDPAVPSWRSSSVEQIAAACVRAVRARYPQGPYRLGGHSLGGLVAFEMACSLVRAGAHVELLMLLDTQAPESFRWRGRIAGRDRSLRTASLLRRARGQANLVRAALINAAALARGERLLRSWPGGFDDPWDQAGAVRISRRYHPAKLAAPVTVVHTPPTQKESGGPELGWGRHVAGPIVTRSIPGEHLSMFREPDVHRLAAVIADELDRLSERSAP